MTSGMNDMCGHICAHAALIVVIGGDGGDGGGDGGDGGDGWWR